MNNNYHTQIDKQSNMLNEIAANNQLLQNNKNQALLQQMQAFSGTPINKNQMNPQLNAPINPQMNPQLNAPINPQMNPQLIQQLTPQQQMMYAQQLAQQAAQNQLYQQQQLNNNQQLPYQKQTQQQNADEEIELSEPKPDPKQKLNEIAQQVKQTQPD